MIQIELRNGALDDFEFDYNHLLVVGFESPLMEFIHVLLSKQEMNF